MKDPKTKLGTQPELSRAQTVTLVVAIFALLTCVFAVVIGVIF